MSPEVSLSMQNLSHTKLELGQSFLWNHSVKALSYFPQLWVQMFHRDARQFNRPWNLQRPLVALLRVNSTSSSCHHGKSYECAGGESSLPGGSECSISPLLVALESDLAVAEAVAMADLACGEVESDRAAWSPPAPNSVVQGGGSM